jgi:hypothetical protein
VLRGPFYHAVPVFVRQLYFPLVQRYKNEHLLDYLQTLKQYEQLSPQVLRQKQEALLCQLVIQAKQNAFWRTRLASLPNHFTAKDTLQENVVVTFQEVPSI